MKMLREIQSRYTNRRIAQNSATEWSSSGPVFDILEQNGLRKGWCISVAYVKSQLASDLADADINIPEFALRMLTYYTMVMGAAEILSIAYFDKSLLYFNSYYSRMRVENGQQIEL